MMNVLAGYGFDVWTMDHDGYGRSGSSGNNSDIASGVEDLKAAMPVVLQESGQQKLHMYGTSSGAIRAGAYAQVAPERVDRLILSAFTYKGTGSPEIARRNAVAERYRNNPRRLRDAAMIRSIFTRDGHASAYDLAVADAIAAEELKFGDQVPTGTYLDMAVNLPLVDPKKVLSPVLMVRGAHDGNSTNEDLLDFYAQLPNGDRQFVILPHTAHSDRLQQQPPSAVVRDAQFPAGAGRGRGVAKDLMVRRPPAPEGRGERLEPWPHVQRQPPSFDTRGPSDRAARDEVRYGTVTGPLVTTRSFQSCAGVPATSSLPAR